jgi:hypothetical protein
MIFVEQLEYAEIIPHCLAKSGTFMGSKLVKIGDFCTEKALRSRQNE